MILAIAILLSFAAFGWLLAVVCAGERKLDVPEWVNGEQAEVDRRFEEIVREERV